MSVSSLLMYSLTVFCGMCFSQVFTPAQWEMDNIVTSSKSGIDYVFGMYSGIMLTSTLIFAIYCAITKNRPRLHREMILGAMGGGFLWAVAQTVPSLSSSWSSRFDVSA